MSDHSARKLSKSRGVNLPIIPLKEFSAGAATSRPMSVANGKRSEGNHAREHSPPLTSSPIGYTLRHTEGHFLAQDSQRSVASESFTVLPDRVGDDVIDIRIFFPDGRAVEFTVEGGVEALAEDLLQLMAEHLGINNELASEALALWLVSPLLEVQLKPHHIAFEVHDKWSAFLQRFTTATEAQIALDEPLLMIRRNVQLIIHRELALESEEELANVLYLDAREALLTSRYLVDKETAITLAALQLAIDFGSFATKDEALDLIH